MTKTESGIIMGWLTGTGPLECQINGYHYTLIRVRKNADFDYLYVQRQYQGVGITRNDKFEYAGVFCKRNGRIYDSQYAIKDLFDSRNGLEARGADALHKQLNTAVRAAVDTAIGNDRNNLRIAALSSERALDKLEHFRKCSVADNARKAYLDNVEDGCFEFHYRCEYRPPQWTEDSLLAYILDPNGYVNAEAKAYIDSHQEDILSDFLESDMVAAAYQEIVDNRANQVHRVKRIMQTLSDSPAKTVTVTINKNGTEFTFKAEAAQFRSDCKHTYGTWHIAAADRKEFGRLFGRSEYGPEDIIRIEYARSVLYEAEAAESGEAV